MKKYFLLTIFLGFLLSGCTKQNVTINTSSNVSGKEQTLLNNNFKKNFNAVTINGNSFTIPFSYVELEKLNCSDNLDDAIIITKGVPIKAEVTASDNSTFSVYIGYQGTKDNGYKKECDIIALYSSKETISNMDLKFYKDINHDSSKEDVAKVLDLLEEDGDNALYGIKLNSYTYLSVSFTGDTVNDIMIANSDGYFE